MMLIVAAFLALFGPEELRIPCSIVCLVAPVIMFWQHWSNQPPVVVKVEPVRMPNATYYY